MEQLPKDKRPQIAFAGRSNVGKSSLLNKLTGRKKLAKVSSTPGKTRALNFFLINEKFYFVDLPGYGYAKVSKAEKESWGKLVGDYLENSKYLAALIILLDCRRDPSGEDLDLIEWAMAKEMPGIAVITKADKLNRDKLNRKVKQIQNQFSILTIPFSTMDGTGKSDIMSAVTKLLEKKH